MPFQSEKQRRFLHANHPEIAKRWERDYGEGGIAALNAQLNQLPEYYLPAAQGGRIGFHRGSTRHQLTHDYKAYAKPSDYLKWAPPSLQISPEVWNPERDAMQTTMKERFMYGEPTQKKEAGSTSKMDQAINAWIKSLFIKEKKNGEDFIDIDQTPGDYAKKREWWEDIPEEEKGPWDTPQKPWWEDDQEFNLVKGGIATHFKKRVKLQDSVESLSDTEFQTMYPDWDPNQFTREEYLQLLSENEGNGVLDLNPDDQPIEFASTEENEIIPDLLAPGSAAGILRLKDGGNIRLQPHTATDLLAKKNPDGTRSKYQPPGHRDAPAPSSRGPREDPDKGGQPSRPTVSETAASEDAYTTPTRTVTTTVERDGKDVYPDRIIRIAEQDKRTAEQEKKTREKRETALQQGWHQFITPRHITPAPKEKSFLDKLAWGIAIYTGVAPLLGWKVPSVVSTVGSALSKKKDIEKGIAIYNKMFNTDYNLDEFVDKQVEKMKESYKERKVKMDLYNSLPDGHPEKIALQIELEIGKKPEHLGDDGGTPLTIDVLAETQEDIEEAPDMISMMDRIRARQAKRAMLVDKGIIQENPIVDESVTDIMTMANKGGLANLFRVKNQ